METAEGGDYEPFADGQALVCSTDMKSLRVRLILFALVTPIFVGLIHSLIGMTVGWTWLFDGHDDVFYGGVTRLRHPLFGVVSSLCLAWGCYEIGKRLSERICFAAALECLVFMAAFLVRVLFLLVFSEGTGLEGGDPEWAWQRAIGMPVADNRHLFFPAWMNFAAFLKLIYRLSGNGNILLHLIGPVSGGLTAVMILLMVRSVLPMRIALSASLLFAFCPTSVAYSFQITPEHIAIPCFAVGSVLVLRAYASAGSFSCRVWKWFLAGVAVALGDAVKPFFPVFMMGTLAGGAAVCCQTREKRQCVFHAVVGIFVMTLVRNMLVLFISSISESSFGCKLDSADPIPHYLSVGLDRTGEGQIHLGRNARTYLKDRMNGASRPFAEAALHERLLTDWKCHAGELPKFLLQKTIWAWGENAYPFHRYLKPSMDTRMWAPYACSLAMVMYFMLLSMALCSTFWLSNKLDREVSVVWVYCGMINLAFFMLLMISEAQGRYKCLIMPYVYVWAAMGFLALENCKGKYVYGK